jgi:Holliday junction resolvase
VSASGQKGARLERELVADFRDAGFAALRCPASGAASDEDLPDLLALRECQPAGVRSADLPLSETFAIECKASKSGSVRLATDEIEALCRYALAAGGTPLVAVRPDREPWSFFEPVALTRAAKSRGVTQAMLPGPSFEDMFDSDPR